jgi:exopolysaccharide biosynthesis polyprenyl glycosylphosphotransferase
MAVVSVKAQTSVQDRAGRVAAFPGTRSGQRSWVSGQRPTDFMAHMFGPHVMPELLGLWLFEVLLSGGLTYRMLVQSVDGDLRPSTVTQAMGLALAIGLVSFAVGLYRSDIYHEERYFPLNTVLVAGLIFASVCSVAGSVGIDTNWSPSGDPLLWLKVLAAWTLCVAAGRFVFGCALHNDMFVRRVIVIAADDGAHAAASRLVTALKSLQDAFYTVVAVLPARDAGQLTPALLASRRIWAVVVSTEARAALGREQIESWSNTRVWSETGFWESQLCRIDIYHPNEAWEPQDVHQPGRLGTAFNRGADILLSLLLLGFTLPLMLVTVLLIKLDSRGPVLYRQERIGLDGRPFTLLKFRSMRTDAEARGPVWATLRDSRVTRVGAFIRLTRIDELPQLINVLCGTMSFIGPRPERPHFVEQIAGQVPCYRERSRVKPGLTGWAQVNYPYGASIEDARSKLSYDLYYIKHRSFLLNVLILLSTVQVVLFPKGAR